MLLAGSQRRRRWPRSFSGCPKSCVGAAVDRAHALPPNFDQPARVEWGIAFAPYRAGYTLKSVVEPFRPWSAGWGLVAEMVKRAGPPLGEMDAPLEGGNIVPSESLARPCHGMVVEWRASGSR